MPALPKNSPILFISPGQSFFANLNTEGKTAELTDVTGIDLDVIKDNQVQTSELEQALSQLQVKSVNLIVSDDIFLHYIGDFPVNDKLSLEEHISNTVGTAFPDQEEPLHIVTLDLAKTARIQTIQITAMTKANLQSISDAFHASSVTLKNMLPASFVVKAFVSIDPSLFVLQTPSSYLLTSHYIGVEYAKTVNSDAIENLTDELTSLKESHPHLQHVYLSLASEDAAVKTAVEEVFPSQPVTIPKVKAESDTPHVLKALALGYREVIENKFPYPQFEMPDSSATASAAVPENIVAAKSVFEEDEKEDTKKTDLPAPVKKEEEKEETKPLEKPINPVIMAPVIPKMMKPEVPNTASDSADATKSAEITPPKVVSPVIKPPVVGPSITPIVASPTIKSDAPSITTIKPVVPTVAPAASTTTTDSKTATAPLKKKRNILSYVLLGTVIAIVIGLVGGGIVISQQALQDNNGNLVGQTEPSPSAVAVATPVPTPAPTPQPIAKESVNILVVNATGKAGYAGTTASALKKAGYTKVQTGNAKGEYDKAGTYIMIKDTEKMKGLETQLEKDATLTLETLTYDKTEDSASTYDVVIVLNQ